jgi:hypothetical protein
MGCSSHDLDGRLAGGAMGRSSDVLEERSAGMDEQVLCRKSDC